MSVFLESRAGRRAKLRTPPESLDFMWGNIGGFRVVSGQYRGGGDEVSDRGGLVAHAANADTVLYPGEYVDEELIAALAAARVGFTIEQLHSVYCTGGLIPAKRRPLRDATDARLLELGQSGANMSLLGRTLGLNDSTVDRALARARQARKEQV